MFRRTLAAATAGSIAGGLLGLLTLALASARVLDAGLTVPVRDDGLLEASFAVGQAGMYVLVLVAGAVGGAILAMIGYAFTTQADATARRYGLGPISALGAVAGAPIAFAAARAAVGIAGDITAKTVVLPVFRASFVAIVAGTVTGLLVAVAVERLSRPEVLGMGGAAAPGSVGQFVRAAAAAVGLPAIGLAIAAVAVFGFSRVLLEADPTVALIAFGGIAAVILGGTALMAARPPRRRR
ncbi:MAG: hypothetical protein HZA58_03715 [Acidimicrobiia bacterium]|nr:hypothetical protein [Acidimicrobiia bacterium]